MKKTLLGLSLLFASSVSIAAGDCRIVISNTMENPEYTVSFNATDVTDGHSGETYSYSFLESNHGAFIPVPCNAQYSIAATPSAPMMLANMAKGRFPYLYGSVFLADPDGSVTVNFPDDFKLD